MQQYMSKIVKKLRKRKENNSTKGKRELDESSYAELFSE